MAAPAVFIAIILSHPMRDENRPTTDFSAALAAARDQHGVSLAERSIQSPTLVVFFKACRLHFCREALADIADAAGKSNRRALASRSCK